jgi:hypothetical protein
LASRVDEKLARDGHRLGELIAPHLGHDRVIARPFFDPGDGHPHGSGLEPLEARQEIRRDPLDLEDERPLSNIPAPVAYWAFVGAQVAPD